MDEKTKELIAIGASIGAHCQPCLTFHVARAKEIGIEDGEIRDAISVGQMVEKGATSAMKQFAGEIVYGAVSPTAGCCGSGKSKTKGCCA